MKSVSDSILPGNVQGWRGLMAEAGRNLQAALGDKHRVVIVGPANTGKSTLYNRLIQSRADRQDVSPLPGTTTAARLADSGLFALVDTPGMDVAGPQGEAQREKAMSAVRQADYIVLILDGSRPVGPKQRALYLDLLGLRKPMAVVLNKIDLVVNQREAVVDRTARALDLPAEDILPISARGGIGLSRLLVTIVSDEPGLVAALGQAMPEYRWQLAQTVISRSASAAAAIALTPLPILSFIPLIGIQSLMALSIARIYGKRVTLARARELLFTFGMGVLGRTLFIELSKLGGPPGWVVSVGVAAGMTVSTGYAVATWFERGERLPSAAILRVARAVAQNLMGRLRGGSRKTLRRQVGEALETLPPRDLVTQSEPTTPEHTP
ncbi:MAG: 50S ribosome-binding GTPase [Anaerolineales bacterium]|nr:50S ribosome-binding GTPase [Anaerolineales bacterium]